MVGERLCACKRRSEAAARIIADNSSLRRHVFSPASCGSSMWMLLSPSHFVQEDPGGPTQTLSRGDLSQKRCALCPPKQNHDSTLRSCVADVGGEMSSTIRLFGRTARGRRCNEAPPPVDLAEQVRVLRDPTERRHVARCDDTSKVAKQSAPPTGSASHLSLKPCTKPTTSDEMNVPLSQRAVSAPTTLKEKEGLLQGRQTTPTS